ncbi:MAG: hypothetical protein WBF90_33855 [Rivularia sp. (in: cyanobacteria)]
MDIPVYDLVEKKWTGEIVQLRNCLLEHLSDEIEYAIGDVSGLRSKKEQDNNRIAQVIDAGFEGYTACGASGSRKNGRLFFSKQSATSFKEYFHSNMNAVNYGSNLTTQCKKVFTQQVSLLVVEDQEWATGDCHGKVSAKLAHSICDANNLAMQFRIALPEYHSIAKGTLVYDYAVNRSKYDIILPTSAFKGNKIKCGEYTTKMVFGLVFTSRPNNAEDKVLKLSTADLYLYDRRNDYGRANSSYSIIQFLSWETVVQDILPATVKQCQKLNELKNDTRKLAEYLRPTFEEDVEETRLFKLLDADIHNQLSTHPFITSKVSSLLRKRWLKLATGGGLKWNSSMVMPDEDMPDDCCYIPSQVNGAEIVVFPYPCRWKHDVKVWTNTYIKKWSKFEGVIVCNTKTALKLGRDYDGDNLYWLPAKRVPAIATEVKTFGEPKKQAVKPSKKELTGTIGEIAVLSMDNLTGLITWVIAKAQACGVEKIINLCVPELQAAVDSLKGATPPDKVKILSYLKSLSSREIAWLQQYKEDYVYLNKALPSNSQDTIGRLVKKVNEYFVPITLVTTKIDAFQDLVTCDSKIPPKWFNRVQQNRAKYARQHYAISQSSVEEEDKRKAYSLVTEVWANSLNHLSPRQKEMVVTAYWKTLHAGHRNSGKEEQASLAFLVGIDEICRQLQELRLNKVQLLAKKHSSFPDTVFTGEKVIAKLVLKDGYYICINQQEEVYGALLGTQSAPVCRDCWFEAHIQTVFDKNGYPVRHDIVIADDF